MKKNIFTWFGVVLLAILVVAAQFPLKPVHAQTAPNPVTNSYSVPQVVIQEVMWAGTYSSSGATAPSFNDQWLELYNTTNSLVDISGWTLSDAAVGSTSLTIPASSIIAPQGYFLISHFNTGSSSILNTTPDDVDATLSLPTDQTTCQPILLQNLQNTTLTTVDSMGCNADGSYFTGNDTTADQSAAMERVTPYADGTQATSWTSDSQSINLTTGANTLATPYASINDLDSSDLVINQNTPGTPDTVAGLSGAASNATSTINVYASNPTSNPAATPLISGPVNPDGSFGPLSIGDNLYVNVWLELSVPLTGGGESVSPAYELANDIVAPNAPSLLSINSICHSNSCQVTVNWRDNGPDTVGYIVEYSNGTETNHSPILTAPTATFCLPANERNIFSVVALDAASNVSTPSNSLTVMLAPNTVATVTPAGTTTVSTLIVSAAIVEPRATVAISELAATSTPATSQTSTSDNTTSESQRNTPPPASAGGSVATFSTWLWVGIIVAIVILLLVAGLLLYFALNHLADQPAGKSIAPPKTTSKKRSTTNLRGRGRPKGSKNKSQAPPGA